MYWELINPKDILCSCGKYKCPFINKIYKEINKKHIAKPLLKIWQIIDKKYWPNKALYKDSVIQKGAKINKKTLDYWLACSADSLNKIIAIFNKYINKEVYLDNTKLFNIGEELSRKSDWGIIVLTRDPRGIMSSYKNAGIRKGDNRSAIDVLPLTKDFLKCALHIKNKTNVCFVRYEDFCKNPTKTLMQLTRFIGINFESKMLNPINKDIKSRGHIIKGNRLLQKKELIRISEDKTWQRNLSMRELNAIYSDKNLKKLYKEFGYNIDK